MNSCGWLFQKNMEQTDFGEAKNIIWEIVVVNNHIRTYLFQQEDDE